MITGFNLLNAFDEFQIILSRYYSWHKLLCMQFGRNNITERHLRGASHRSNIWIVRRKVIFLTPSILKKIFSTNDFSFTWKH